MKADKKYNGWLINLKAEKNVYLHSDSSALAGSGSSWMTLLTPDIWKKNFLENNTAYLAILGI